VPLISESHRSPLAAGTDEDCLHDFGEDREFGAQGARRGSGCVLREVGDCGGVEWQCVSVGALRVGIFAVNRSLLVGEIHQSMPESSRAEEALL
jgi:hypothetical protein